MQPHREEFVALDFDRRDNFSIAEEHSEGFCDVSSVSRVVGPAFGLSQF
jgi:hypothetical protein